MLPEQAVSQITHAQEQKKDGIEAQVSEFKTVLQKILTDETIPPEKQMQLYNQLFSRYLKLDADLKEPTTVIMKNIDSDKYVDMNDGKNESQVIQDRWKKTIFQKMPKMHKEKANGLINFLNKSKQLSILDTGEVSINDTVLPQSNIVNLVHDIVRGRPKAPGPLGFKNFAMLLKDLNVPKEFVGNQSRWNMIKDDLHTPDSKTSKAPLKRKLNYTEQKGSGKLNKMRPKYISW